MKSKISEEIRKVKEAFSLRVSFNDFQNLEVMARIGRHFETLEEKDVKWHAKSGYATFCSKTNLTRLQMRTFALDDSVIGESSTKQGIKDASSVTLTRKPVPEVKWNLCIFCQKKHRDEVLHQVLTKDSENITHDIARYDKALHVNCRIAALDLIEYEVKYHHVCKSKWSGDYKLTEK